MMSTGKVEKIVMGPARLTPTLTGKMTFKMPVVMMTGYQDVPLWSNPALIGHLTLTHDIFHYYSSEFRMGLKQIKFKSNGRPNIGTSPAFESSEGIQTSKRQR